MCKNVKHRNSDEINIHSRYYPVCCSLSQKQTIQVMTPSRQNETGVGYEISVKYLDVPHDMLILSKTFV